MTTVKLRKYQEAAIEAVEDAIGDGVQRPAVVLPTGMGKTVIFAHLIRDRLRAYGGRALVMVHREELITQAAAKLKEADPSLTVGVIKGPRDERDVDVIIGSVQTLARRLGTLAGLANLVIVDECHHASAETWVAVLENLGCFSASGPPAVGFTATMVRADAKGLGNVWDRVVFRKDILDGISQGFLANVRGKVVQVDGMSLEEVRVSNGDYAAQPLAEMLITSGALAATAEAYLEHAPGQSAVLFAPTVQAAELFAEAFQDAGVPALPVFGDLDPQLRRDRLRAFEAGALQVITNPMLLVEGWDSPRASVAIIARPTRSPGLYVQMVGRVLRPYPGKEEALVLDLAGATAANRLATLADLSTERIPEVREGETLTEAAARARAEGVPELAGYVSYRDVDLFERSASLWLATHAGVWFIPVQEGLIFLWPTDDLDRFRVGFRYKRPQGGERGRWLRGDKPMSLEYAMSWAEQCASESLGARTLSSRSAAWRRRNSDPTEAQVRTARGLRIEIPDGITKSALSDMITIELASRALDGPMLALQAKIKEEVGV